MKENLITVLNPTGRVVASDSKIAPRLQDLNKKTLGLIDNQKYCADIILDVLKNNLSSKYNFKEIITFKKTSSAEPADFIDDFPGKFDCIINGVGH